MTEIRKRWWIAALLIPALIAVGVVRGLFFQRSPLSRLQDAARGQSFRPIEARLLLLPDHRPVMRRRGSASATISPLQITALAVLADHVTDVRLRASAMMLAGDSRSAVDLFRRIEKPDAATFSDLSAALVTESEASGRIELATDAVAAADQALRLDPSLAAASFNRAIALQHLGLFGEARAEWLRYAQLDPASPWSVEARVAATSNESEPDAIAWKGAEKELRSGDATTIREVVARFPQLSRVYAEGVYLGEWADGNAASLDLARAIGRELAKLNGESLLLDAVGAIDHENRDGAPILAKAHRIYRDGRLAFRDHKLVEAHRKLLAAEDVFTRGGSPMALVARYYRASVLYEQNRIDDAEQLLDGLARTVAARPTYRALTAQIGWERGACRMAKGSLDRAREIFSDSRLILDDLGERELRAVFDIHLAQVYEYLGDTDAAWQHRRPAFETLSRTGNELRVQTAVAAAASSRIRREEWSRGAALAGVAATMAERLKRPELAEQSWILSGVAASGEERRDDASADLQKAERWSAEIADPTIRGRLDAELGIANAVALRATSPGAAIAAVDRSIAYFERSGHRIFLTRAHLERARAHRAMGRAVEAIEDVERGIEVAEQQRAAVHDFEERAAFFAATKALFLEGIEAALSSGDMSAAFDTLERGRARAIIDAFADSNSAKPMTAAEIQRRLAPDAAIVSYVALPQRVAIFVIRDHGVTEASSPHSPATLRASIDALNVAIDGRDARAISAAQKDLHSILLSPIERHLDGLRTVAVVPDPSTGAVPFGFLASGDFAVISAPSATVAIECSLRQRSARGTPLLVGASVFDRGPFGRSSELQSIEPELNAISREWPEARRLTGAKATTNAFERMALGARFIHFAGHAVDRLHSPADAHLLLAPAAADHGRLSAARIATLDLRGTELVVLNACRAASPSENSDGFMNLATAFIIAGVPTVIAPTNDVDDATAVEFSQRLHFHLRRGEPAEAALQRVMRGELDTGGIARTAAYAGFTAIGGSKSLVRE